VRASATNHQRAAADSGIVISPERTGAPPHTAGLPEALRANLNHEHWETMAERCIGCTNCTMVCPTCFCYDVQDRVDLRLETVLRERTWDSCFSLQFAAVHGGNFRGPLKNRYRHLIHKLYYWVGPVRGVRVHRLRRCITWCPVGIASHKVARYRSRRGGSSVTSTTLAESGRPPGRRQPPRPRKARIVGIRRLTYNTATYTMSFADPELNRSYRFLPGQFNMLSLFGVGEAAVSMSSDVTKTGTFDHTIRSVGNVTNAVATLAEGAEVGIRGPYGTAWPLEQIKGRPVLVVTGGSATRRCGPRSRAFRNRPIRAALAALARVRSRLFFREELLLWAAQSDTTSG